MMTLVSYDVSTVDAAGRKRLRIAKTKLGTAVATRFLLAHLFFKMVFTIFEFYSTIKIYRYFGLF